jgi:tripartite-type tricarboxylate transporter receptor subunit TctC
VVAFQTPTTRADEVADFYKGKTIQILVGFPPGGGYDLYARVVERHLGKHVPGNPSIIVKNMPGGTGVRAAAYMSNATPQDGLTLGTFLDNLTLLAMVRSDVKFEPGKLVWIGRVTTTTTVALVWHTAKAKTVEDTRASPIKMAAEARAHTSAFVSIAINEATGSRIEPVYGYRGSQEFALAMERGEADAAAGMSWGALKTTKPDWLAEKRVGFLWLIGTRAHPELPGVRPLPAFAANEEQKKLFTFIGSSTEIGRGFAAEPGIPADRAKALRTAFMAMVKDPGFVADAQKHKLEVNPASGEELQQIVSDMLNAPAALIGKVKALAGE